MKKAILIGIVGLVVLALGANWYYTREIRQQLDRMAAAVSMFGSLSYDSVRLSPAGAIHINGLEFFMRGAEGDAIRIDRVALRTGSLGALVTLKREIEAGRLPAELGIAIEGLEFSLGSLPVGAGPAFSPAPAAGDGVTGPGFAAAGCDGRERFSVDDLVDMDYFLVEGDMEAHYRFLDDGDRMRQFLRFRGREAGEVDVEVVLDVMAGSMSTLALMQALQRADLRALTFGYVDLGFYDRMLTFCANRMDMDREAYIDHHIDAWVDRWASLGVRPAPSVIEAYRDFVENPDRFRIRSRSQHSVDLAMIGEYDLPAFFERMDMVVSVGGGEPVAMAVEPVEPVSPAPDAVAGAGPAQPPADPPGDGDGRSGADERTEASAAGAADRAAAGRVRNAGRAAAAERREARWTEIAVGELPGQIDRTVRLVLDGGRRVVGRLERVDADFVHIRFIGDSGYYVRPFRRAEIGGAAVRDGVP